MHILPAGKHCLKHELFSIEGTGTLIANNFNETLSVITSSDQINIVMDLLKPYIKKGLIKPRTLSHIEKHRDNFFISEIDGIAVGCVEKIDLDETTTELGALAVAGKYRNQQIGLFLIESFVELARKRGYKRVISLTRNPKLQKIYLDFGFVQTVPRDLEPRKNRSPGVPMFVFTP